MGEIKLFPAAGMRCSHVKLLLPAHKEPRLIRKPAELCDYSAASPTKEAPDSIIAAIPIMEKVWRGGAELWLSPLDWVTLRKEQTPPESDSNQNVGFSIRGGPFRFLPSKI